MKSKSLSSSLFTTLGLVVPIAAVGLGNACTSDFEGCAASRSCGAAAGEAGEGGSDATGGKAGAGGTGAGGRAGGPAETGGESGEGGDGAGGKGGTSGSSTGATGGSDAGQGGGDDEGGSPGTGGGSSTAGSAGTAGLDTIPPTITLKRLTRLVAPSADRDETDLEGAVGVAADTNLVLTFSEPMDRVTTQAAFQSADIPGVTFAWSSDDTVLTITPNVDLAYAMGDPDVGALSHTISITDTAEDQAGNRMASTWTGTFGTLRHVSQTITASGTDDVRHLHITDNRGCGSSPWIGDDSSNESSCMAIQFDLALIPAGVVSWLGSTARGEFMSRDGDAFSLMGDIHFYEFDAIPISTASWSTMPIVDRGVFAFDDRQYPSIDLLGSMPDAYATQSTNGTLLQYRLSFPIQTNSDETIQVVRFACNYDLDLEYLIP